MRDVADHAGVSPMTVSRALRDDPQVSSEKKARVLEAVNALGYRRNDVARNLRLGRSSGVIGVVVPNLANPFYAQVALGVEAAAAERGARVMIGNSGGDVAHERQLIQDFASRRLEGVVAVPTGTDVRLDDARLSGLRVVLGGSPPAGADIDCVLLDDFGGTLEATRHLIRQQHRRIAFLGLHAAVWTGSERFRGYCAALEEAGIEVEDRYVVRQQPDVAAAERATLGLLELDEPPTALFAANNRNTVGAYRAIFRSKAETVLAGFDDFELADMLALPLTVVAVDAQDMGVQAANLLFDRLDSDAGEEPVVPRRVVIPARVVDYGSS
ncbi:LacI family DNA-binding transcriptional regulator [Streptomyces tubercidicus]|uniref:LacI family DNA-binding transcriptional regulator n=1 Tax=Streptomyces tubercidicus TaxID=47759 RepID=UPI0036862AF0